ncbi:MAG: DUF2892 domain-containing protein [Alphaproteobacteria bacterium]
MSSRVLRQVQLVVGCLILAGVGVTYWVSPYGLVLCTIAGLGLLQASITGICPMENILAKMPWNKMPKSGDCGCGNGGCGAE